MELKGKSLVAMRGLVGWTEPTPSDLGVEVVVIVFGRVD